MKTPKEYTDNLKKGIITEEMLESALYSVNKRAKNWRDKKREYKRCYYDKYHNFEKAEAAEKEMYRKKEILLKLLTPVCIHREFAGYSRMRIYDYEQHYNEQLFDALMRGQVAWENCYRKRSSYDDYFDDWCDYGEIVSFFDREDYSDPQFRYYLFYVIGGHSFHTPIQEWEVSRYGYPVVTINELDTAGDGIIGLCSVQFVDKLIAVIQSGEYEFVQTKQIDKDKYLVSEEIPSPGVQAIEWSRIVSMASPHILSAIRNTSVSEKLYTLTEEDRKEVEKYCEEQLGRAENCKAKNEKKREKGIRKILNPRNDAFLPKKVTIEYSEELYKAIFECSGGVVTYGSFEEGMKKVSAWEQAVQEFARKEAMNKLYREQWEPIAADARKKLLGDKG